ncbi:hypothetical protein [Sinomonas soli]
MAVSSHQRTPVSRRVRIRVAAAAALAVILVLVCAGGIVGTLAYPLSLALLAAWSLRANEARNGRR